VFRCYLKDRTLSFGCGSVLAHLSQVTELQRRSRVQLNLSIIIDIIAVIVNTAD
jgi:hypothetical protein